MPDSGPSKQIQKIQQIVAAAQEYIPAKTSLTLNGQSVAVADFLSTLNDAISANTAVTTAEAQVASARSTRTQQIATALADIAALKQFLIVTYGKSASMLPAFGFAPKAKAVQTAAQKALASAQRVLTRKVRGTTSKKQKLQITAAGKAGLMLVQPDGTQVPGIVPGPQAPAVPPPPPAAAMPAASKPTTTG